MLIKVNRKDFSKALRFAKLGMHKRYSMPILQSVKLDASSSNLIVSCTDLEVYVAQTISGVGDETGAALVDHKSLAALVRKLKDDVLTLKTDGVDLVVTGRSGSTRLAGSAVEEYPLAMNALDMTDGKGGRVFCESFDCGKLREILESVTYAASVDETRYNLNSVHVAEADASSGLVWEATDGHRLAQMRLGGHSLGLEKAGVMLPVPFVKAVLAALQKPQDYRAYLSVGKLDVKIPGARFTVDGCRITARLVDGEYPKTDQVIPKASGRSVDVEREALLDALESLCAVDIKVGVEIGPASLHLKAGANGGTATRAVEGCRVLGCEGKTFGVNARYLSEALQALGGQRVRLDLGAKPALAPMKLVGSDDAPRLAVVMPMRLA